MPHQLADLTGALCVDGFRRFRWVRPARRTVFVTSERVIVADSGRVAADYPRCAVTARTPRAGRLVVELAGRPFALDVPAGERGHAAAIAAALRLEPPVAALSDVNLPSRSRRALRIHAHTSADVVVTDQELLFLARRHGRAQVAFRCPRAAAHVLEQVTMWPDGDRTFDRVRVRAGDATVEFDLDGTRHEGTAAVVAALGGVPQSPTSRKAHP